MIPAKEKVLNRKNETAMFTINFAHVKNQSRIFVELTFFYQLLKSRSL